MLIMSETVISKDLTIPWLATKIMFNLDRVYMILDEMIINGTVAQTSKERILIPVQLLDTSEK